MKLLATTSFLMLALMGSGASAAIGCLPGECGQPPRPPIPGDCLPGTCSRTQPTRPPTSGPQAPDSVDKLTLQEEVDQLDMSVRGKVFCSTHPTRGGEVTTKEFAFDGSYHGDDVGTSPSKCVKYMWRATLTGEIEIDRYDQCKSVYKRAVDSFWARDGYVGDDSGAYSPEACR